ncbi:MAG: hypothetical protein VYD12_09635 [Pseudomonadota bacterium]|nr:hypothetical protein [Pseudomonadota bacterium]
MKKKLLCLNVELLKAYEHAKPVYGLRLPSPRLCSVLVTAKLIDIIDKAQVLIEEHGLEEVAFRTLDVNWFNSLNDLIFQEIRSCLHITKNSIYFTGAFAPENKPVFISTRLPLSAIDPCHHSSTELNLSLLSSNRAQAIIDDIENLDREMKVAWERQESLESLGAAIVDLKPSSPVVLENKTDALASEINCEIRELEKTLVKLEYSVEEQCINLCKEVLGISVGDRIITQTRVDNKHLEIQISSIRYYDGTLFIDGIKVLKNGTLGKRTETAFVSLRSDDER